MRRDGPYVGYLHTGHVPKRRTPPRDRRGRFVSSRSEWVYAWGHRSRRGGPDPGTLTLLLCLACVAIVRAELAGCAYLVDQHRARVGARRDVALQVEQRRRDELEAIGSGARGWSTWSAENGMPVAALVWAAIADEHLCNGPGTESDEQAWRA